MARVATAVLLAVAPVFALFMFGGPDGFIRAVRAVNSGPFSGWDVKSSGSGTGSSARRTGYLSVWSQTVAPVQAATVLGTEAETAPVVPFTPSEEEEDHGGSHTGVRCSARGEHAKRSHRHSCPVTGTIPAGRAVCARTVYGIDEIPHAAESGRNGCGGPLRC